MSRSRAWYKTGFPGSRISRTAVLHGGASNETNTQVQTGGQLVGDLSSQMQDLNKRMETVASSIQSLSEENAKIIEILATLDRSPPRPIFCL